MSFLGSAKLEISTFSMVYRREWACSFRINRTHGYVYRTVEMWQTVIANACYPRSAVIGASGASKPVPYKTPMSFGITAQAQTPTTSSKIRLSVVAQPQNLHLTIIEEKRSFSTSILHSPLSILNFENPLSRRRTASNSAPHN